MFVSPISSCAGSAPYPGYPLSDHPLDPRTTPRIARVLCPARTCATSVPLKEGPGHGAREPWSTPSLPNSSFDLGTRMATDEDGKATSTVIIRQVDNLLDLRNTTRNLRKARR
jgi:hypothetical protein